MAKLGFYTDIHSHPTLRAFNCYNDLKNRNLWVSTDNEEFNTIITRFMRIQTKDIIKYSQSNFYRLHEGNVRIIFDNLYPVEKGWLSYRKFASMFFSDKATTEVFLTTTGVARDKYHELKKKKSYFNELKDQYDFLLNGQGYSPNKKAYYKLANNYQEIKSIVSKDNKGIVVVPCIEGAHSFESGNPLGQKLQLEEHKALLSKNIAHVKSWDYPPFYVTFAHHYWNDLCGHAKSLKPPVNLAFNQDAGINKGISQLGWHVIKELLTTQNGKRILIDTKHMSVKARLEFYSFITTHNAINPFNKIPIICSHAGINGYSGFSQSTKENDTIKKMGNGYFNRWSINLNNDEIKLIYDSGGIIGLILDKTILGGTGTIDKINKLKSSKAQKDAYMKLIWSNIFGIVKAIDNKNAWNHISLGTDFDGLINSIEFYPDMSYLPELNADMTDYLKRTKFKEELWYGYSPSALVYRIFTKNTLDFLSTHYH